MAFCAAAATVEWVICQIITHTIAIRVSWLTFAFQCLFVAYLMRITVFIVAFDAFNLQTFIIVCIIVFFALPYDAASIDTPN